MSDKITSKDGTQIAYDKIGNGPALVLVGATPDRTANTQLVELLAPHFTVYNYDRRGHGDSSDAQPYAVEREFEDFEAVLDATREQTYVYGSSGNGIFAFKAIASGLQDKVKKLAVWETPFIVDDSRAPIPSDYLENLKKMLAEGRHGDMVELFMTEAVGMPKEFVAPMRSMPMWPAFEAAAPTLIYDAQVMNGFVIPEDIAQVTMPVLVMDGGSATWPWVHNGLEKLATALPDVERLTLEGQQHNVESTAVAPALIKFFKD